jgi:Leucine-rich repeat (LRR) protein
MDDNKISDLSDIMDMDCLIKLSCSRNTIEQIDLTKAKWCVLLGERGGVTGLTVLRYS